MQRETHRHVTDREDPAEADVGPYRRIWSLAWPVSISTSTVTLLTLVNLFWIGHLGTVAVAAVSLCGQILFAMFISIAFEAAVMFISYRRGTWLAKKV